ncbi:hypothetical protein DV735_g2360, partial [Chaetothyriales sp. CBS 134920]
MLGLKPYLAARPRPQHASITDLPPEILSLILELVYLDGGQRPDALLPVSLASKGLRKSALAILCREILCVLRDEDDCHHPPPDLNRDHLLCLGRTLCVRTLFYEMSAKRQEAHSMRVLQYHISRMPRLQLVRVEGNLFSAVHILSILKDRSDVEIHFLSVSNLEEKYELRTPADLIQLARLAPRIESLGLDIGCIKNLWHPTAIPGVNVDPKVYSFLASLSNFHHLHTLRLFPSHVDPDASSRLAAGLRMSYEQLCSDLQVIRIFNYLRRQNPKLSVLIISPGLLRGARICRYPISRAWQVRTWGQKTLLVTRQPEHDYELSEIWVGERKLSSEVKRDGYKMGLGVKSQGDDDWNKNPPPNVSIYPRLSEQDAPYSVPEEDEVEGLRSAIFMPRRFKFGQDGKTPVILVPGTGSYGGETYGANFAKLLAASSFADPVWVNVPGRMCGEAARNAEYVAYAINYIASRCTSTGGSKGRGKVAVVGWSQGNIAIQWSLKYWPSTRERTPDSRFVAALRADGGDSAYVPTTSIYSALDEAVQPQWGARASARMKDARNVGVTNCQVVGTPSFWTLAGWGFYSHDGVLLSPIAWALTEDAIRNGGPGRLDRIDMATASWRRIAPGLTLLDESRTRTVSVCCLKNIVAFAPKSRGESALPLYVTATAETNASVEEEEGEDIGTVKLRSKL